MKNSDLDFSKTGLNECEIKLVNCIISAANTKQPLWVAVILGILMIYNGFKFFPLYAQNIFFLIFNAAIWAGIICLLILSYIHGQSIKNILRKLIDKINQ
jgi:Na+/H+-dicarboxylate symporter